jgi:hypothetical protein
MTEMTAWRQSVDLVHFKDVDEIQKILGHTRFWLEHKKAVGNTICDQFTQADWEEVWEIDVHKHERLKAELEAWLKRRKRKT